MCSDVQYFILTRIKNNSYFLIPDPPICFLISAGVVFMDHLAFVRVHSFSFFFRFLNRQFLCLCASCYSCGHSCQQMSQLLACTSSFALAFFQHLSFSQTPNMCVRWLMCGNYFLPFRRTQPATRPAESKYSLAGFPKIFVPCLLQVPILLADTV